MESMTVRCRMRWGGLCSVMMTASGGQEISGSEAVKRWLMGRGGRVVCMRYRVGKVVCMMVALVKAVCGHGCAGWWVRNERDVMKRGWFL